jgi:hypothetical protein
VLPLDLDLLRFDNIVHSGRSVAERERLGKQKFCLVLTRQKADILPPFQLLAA